ncbi:MAG: heat-inducible transcriptional repressor HrcA [Candidatus Saelkia tenebricola]|nr:heat-inducible transcriptional repressor HrcA [Candidatus Saelkia tenebricola]
MLNTEKTEERKKKILTSIVKTYIETASPVASKMLVSKYRLDFSPATVRNIMAELEDMGYLQHLHTSSGRIPTDKGYRHYVDTIMETQQLTPSEKKKILMKLINAQWEEMENLLESALNVVSNYTNQMSVLVYYRARNIYVEKIDLIYINKLRILFIIVADSGDVVHLFIEDENLPKIDELSKLLNFVNSELKGEALNDIKNKIKKNLISSHNPFYHVFSNLLILLIEALENIEEKAFLYQGTNKITKCPEFNNVSVLHNIIDMLEKEVELVKMLESDFKGSDISIHIGRENPYQCAHNCCIISAQYKLKGRVLGTIGVLGPTRLPYGRTVSVVKYVSEILGQALESALF